MEGSPDPAVLVLEKLPFSEVELLASAPDFLHHQDTATAILSSTTSACQEFTNDVYGQYMLQPEPRHNMVKANVIHPATEKHIEK